ncbi:hypothetical protein [Novosphingobium album (ex Liu et al. 2023)]|uniref:Uncharacterized protein n=1 Tax=Novosphingobium album (ex Liu et al. 2023) TaxID=3031130 RepID=A0ABT5WWJ6_9SPHN|nr:hypothetical protein [Novosphingobium album (ex Liu et al. 2023)]MDE8654267.1 hypothetical protein [Novosphingobium album (ex Liu et al. 2023)]
MSIDWGNAADWASAVASAGAVFAALWIAFGQERNARKLRQLARNEEHERKAQLVSEVIRLTAAIEAEAAPGARVVDVGGGRADGLVSQKDAIEGLRLQLRALQQFPQTDPRIYGEIGRIIQESELPAGFVSGGTSYQGLLLRGLADRLTARRETLVGLLGA